jgi:creatinine amidohydrolase
MGEKRMRRIFATGFVCLGLLVVGIAARKANQRVDPVPTRDMSDINWMEFKETVPAKCDTVILPTGTLEPHGVINNGADIIAPLAIAKAIAREVNAMIAPVVPYGITGSMDAYPGAFSISESAYRGYMKDVLNGLAKNRFKTIVIVNGHGGPQTAVLNELAREVGEERGVRTLVINWWSYASDVTQEVFGQDGGHAGLNETAFIQAIDKRLVHPERYSNDLATPNAPASTYSAYPAPSSIGLYKAGQGFVSFDQKKADDYFAKVNRKVAGLILEMKAKWDKAGL